MTATATKVGAPTRTDPAGGVKLLFVVTVMVWGVNWPVIKHGLDYISPFRFAAFRLGSASLALLAMAALRRRLRMPHRGDWPVVLSIGLVQMALVMSLVNIATQYVAAGRSAVLVYTTPLWITPMAVVFLHERFNAPKVAGLLVGLAGLAVLFNPASLDWSDRDTVLGNALLLFAAFAWAAVMVHIRTHRWMASPLDLLPWQFAVGAVPVIVMGLVMEAGETIEWGVDLWGVLLFNGVIATAFAFWAMITVNRALPAVLTSMGFLAVPVVGVTSSTIALGEPLTWSLLVSLILIIAGIALVLVPGQTEQRKPAVAARLPG